MRASPSFEDTYINIQGWMTTDLNLKGNELLAFALVWGFCQDGESIFRGKNAYIEKWLGCSRKTVTRTMDSLSEKNLISKWQEEIQGVSFNRYQPKFEVIEQTRTKLPGGGQNVPGGWSKLPGGVAKMSHVDTILDTIIDKPLYKEEIYKKIGIENESEFQSLPPEEQRIKKALAVCNLFLKKWPAQKNHMIETAKIKPDDPQFDFDSQMEEWIRHQNTPLGQVLMNPGKELSRGFQSWLMKFNRFKPKTVSNRASLVKQNRTRSSISQYQKDYNGNPGKW